MAEIKVGQVIEDTETGVQASVLRSSPTEVVVGVWNEKEDELVWYRYIPDDISEWLQTGRWRFVLEGFGVEDMQEVVPDLTTEQAQHLLDTHRDELKEVLWACFANQVQQAASALFQEDPLQADEQRQQWVQQTEHVVHDRAQAIAHTLTVLNQRWELSDANTLVDRWLVQGMDVERHLSELRTETRQLLDWSKQL